MELAWQKLVVALARVLSDPWTWAHDEDCAMVAPVNL